MCFLLLHYTGKNSGEHDEEYRCTYQLLIIMWGSVAVGNMEKNIYLQ